MGLFDFLTDWGKTAITNAQQTTTNISSQLTTTYAPNITYPAYTITPQIQYNPQFLINSAGASATGGQMNPTVTPSQIIMPTTTTTPTQTVTQTPTQTATASAGGGGMDWTTIAIIGIVGLAAYLILTNKKGRENVKKGYHKAKSTAKKGVKYGAKAAKYAAVALA